MMRKRNGLNIAGLLAAGVFFLGAVQLRAAGTTSGGELGATKKPALTNDAKIAEGESIQRRGSQLAERISKMLDGARRDKDIMRANCLNRKLTEVNANVRNTEGRLKALRDAGAGGDEGRANHEFTVLSVIAQKFDTADQEASQCLGQDVYESGASQVVTTIDDDTTEENPAGIPVPPTAPPSVTVPPPYKADDTVAGTTKLQNSLNQLANDRKDADNEENQRRDAQNASDAAKQKADAFLAKNWIDRNGYVVQLNSKVLRPDDRTVTKVDYTTRTDGPQSGTSVFSNRVSFNRALPDEWALVYSRGLNDPANLAGGSPEYWRTLQQVSAFSPGSAGCLLCFTSQYAAPGPVAGGAWGQPRTFAITHLPTGSSAVNLLSQSFAADGSLIAGSDQLNLDYSGGAWNYNVNGGTSAVLTLAVTGLSDLGRTLNALDGNGGGWSGLRGQVKGRPTGSYLELTFKPAGSLAVVDLLISPDAFLEAF
jgi:hypothetical protein